MWVRTTTGADWNTCALRLQAKTDVTWQGYLQFNGSGNAYGISFGCGGSNISPINVAEAMRITNAGSVGIGTTTPSQRLDVNGSINCTGLLVNGTAVATGTGSVWGVSGSNISYTSGLVSIGTVVNPTPNSVGTTNLATYGNVCVYRNRVIFSHALTDWNHTIYNNYYNNDGEGSWDGMKMNVYAGLSIRVGNAGGVIPTTAMYINNSGQVGIGTTNPILRTHINGGIIGVSGSYSNSQPNKTIRMGYNDNSSGGDYAWIYSYDTTASTYKNICINEAGVGNVGIGTNNPLAKLHIATADPGTTTAISFQNTSGFGIYASSTAISARGNTLDWYSYDYNNTAITTRHVLTMRPEGNVGIGTASPSINGRLHIHGATATTGLIISNTTNVNAQCIFGVDGNGNLFLTPLLQGSFFSSVVPGADNSCALGGSSYRWTAVYAVNGTIQTSDSSVKDSVPLSYGINEVLQMRTIKYKWKSQANLPDDDPKKNFEYYGFCADELGALFPELVYDEDKTAPVQLNYTELLPVVVNAMKDVHASLMVQKTVVDNQASRITSLESALADKSAQLDALLTWARSQGFAG